MILDGGPSYHDPPEVHREWIRHLTKLRRQYAGDPSNARLIDDALEDARTDLAFVEREGTYKVHRFQS